MATLIISLTCALAILLACIGLLAVGIRRGKKDEILQAAVDFRSPHWMILFISFGVIAVGGVGILIAALMDHFLRPSTDFSAGTGVFLLSLMLIAFGVFLCWLCAIVCLWCLLSALVSHARSKDAA